MHVNPVSAQHIYDRDSLHGVLRHADNKSCQQLPTAVRVGTDHVTPLTVACDLEIYIDGDVSRKCQMTRTVAGRFAVPRQLRTIRRSVFQSLFVSRIQAQLDYGNASRRCIHLFINTAGCNLR